MEKIRKELAEEMKTRHIISTVRQCTNSQGNIYVSTYELKRRCRGDPFRTVSKSAHIREKSASTIVTEGKRSILTLNYFHSVSNMGLVQSVMCLKLEAKFKHLTRIVFDRQWTTPLEQKDISLYCNAWNKTTSSWPSRGACITEVQLAKWNRHASPTWPKACMMYVPHAKVSSTKQCLPNITQSIIF